MSLYHEASAAIINKNQVGGSLKARIYASKQSKHAPAQIYALVSQTTKWTAVLKEVLTKTQLLACEKKLNHVLAMLLLHDHLLTKRGIIAPQSHPLRLAILRHKARLHGEFTKLRLRHGFSTLDEFRQSIEGQQSQGSEEQGVDPILQHPKWIRVNVLKTTLEAELQSTFAGYEHTDMLSTVIHAHKDKQLLLIDKNIENLIGLPPRHEIHKSEAYRTGRLIFQDKASCFPALLVGIDSGSGEIIDACAAPGNKTSHLASILSTGSRDGARQAIHAFERDQGRSKTLQKMIVQAGAASLVKIHAATDFLQISPTDSRFKRVTGILLDPSCSGSGIVGRDDDETSLQYSTDNPSLLTAAGSDPCLAHRKRKRGGQVYQNLSLSSSPPPTGKDPEQRLEKLSRFQLKLLRHCMDFAAARRIVYSTCSVHFQENERVVLQALSSEQARVGNWKLLPRRLQAPGLASWQVRGVEAACAQYIAENGLQTTCPSARRVADACIRCEKGTEAGTMGFFVACLYRECLPDKNTGAESYDKVDSEEDEWVGFSDSE